MNKVKGIIKSVEFNDYISLVNIGTEIGPLSLVLLETPSKVDYLKEGKEVTAIFNPTALKLSKEEPKGFAVDNIISCQVLKINHGKILSAVILKSKTVELTCYATTKALQKASIQEGQTIFGIISPTEIMLEV